MNIKKKVADVDIHNTKMTSVSTLL